MSGSSGTGVARVLATVARDINAPRDVASTLDTIVNAAQRSLPGIDHVGVSITHRDGTIETMAATDPLVLKLDQLQYELSEGPCVDSLRDAEVVSVSYADRYWDRWPRYMPKAVDLGLRAQLALRLYVEESTLGGLNLYSTESDELPPDTPELAEIFAAHAALALGRANTEQNLNTALATRKAIGQAIGILMVRYELTEERAFQYLSRVSQTGNIKLRDVALELVAQTEAANQLPGEPPASGGGRGSLR
ncbi:GAF and ANTAR domain-containing protein [Pedococcus sp. 5OH_020]|uniref:GAF and ANTAR domain-containing protein n=1 Tax=Pedococcus sp. 5OH_020 TaxID=2989814 RepID=UPI0022E9B606|nr:GAF and ANTAR domain-containing protein [Pedococcus sp. 5OH_020]